MTDHETAQHRRRSTWRNSTALRELPATGEKFDGLIINGRPDRARCPFEAVTYWTS